MTRATELDNGTKIAFTPFQLVFAIGLLLSAAAWCWRMDARAEAHEKTANQLQASMVILQDDLKAMKAELTSLRKGGYTLTPTQTPVTETR